MKQKSIFKSIIEIFAGLIIVLGFSALVGVCIYNSVPAIKDKVDTWFETVKNENETDISGTATIPSTLVVYTEKM